MHIVSSSIITPYHVQTTILPSALSGPNILVCDCLCVSVADLNCKDFIKKTELFCTRI
jgi:hypothetical protein